MSPHIAVMSDKNTENEISSINENISQVSDHVVDNIMNPNPVSDVAESVCKKRYYQRDHNGNIIEDWTGLVNRVVNHVCSKESQQFKNEMFRIIHNTVFLPNSPCLVNAGRKGPSGLLACNTSAPPGDSWEEIVRNIECFGIIARRGGGNGTCFSYIRPAGDPVFGSTHAKACGPVEVMRMTSEVMHSITQSGFRGMACMGTLHVWHPDIVHFIKCKQKENALKTYLREDIFGHYDQLNGKSHEHLNIVLDKFISNFNISVVVSDKFMRAVETDDDWNLEFNGKIYKTVKAREIFDLIATNAWKNGDPGLLFDDAINDSPYKYSGQTIDATNPCVIEGSLVPTQNGWQNVENLKVGDHIFTKGKLLPITSIEKNNNCEVFNVQFTDGDYVVATAAHRFKTIVGKKYEYQRLDELESGAKIRVETFDWSICNQEEVDVDDDVLDYLRINGVKTNFAQYDLGQLLGIVIGDGCYTESLQGAVKVIVGKHEIEWIKYLQNLLRSFKLKYSVEDNGGSIVLLSRQLGKLVEGLKLKPAKAIDKLLPAYVLSNANIEFYKGLLDGLFSTDGNMYLKKDNPMLRYTSANYELCRQIKYILMGFGIHARIYKSLRKKHIYNDPKYGDREISNKNPKYDIYIMNDGIVSFHKQIKLHNIYKQEKIKKCTDMYHVIGGNRSAAIKKIEKMPSTYTTYDLYVESTDEWNVHGYVQKGCGEQPLPTPRPTDKLSKNTGGSCNLGSIDIAKLYDATTNDIDWLEFKRVIQACVQFLDDVIDVNVFPASGFAKWAYENRPVGLGIMGWADLLLKMKMTYGSEKSLQLAEKVAKFMEDTAHDKSVELAKERGTPLACKHEQLGYRRNVTLTSIAPTGTISLLAGCSSSIEPVFSPTIFRYDNTGQYCIPHPDADKKYFKCAVDKGNPDREVPCDQHIQMQAAWQRYVSSGISKTVNLRNSATIDDIKQAYMLAWKLKCKGITIYRDGCKTTQVLNTSKKTLLAVNNAPKRPVSVNARVFKTTAIGHDWHVIIGMVDDLPYELFAVNGKNDLPSNAMIVKRKRQHYSLTDENNVLLIDNIVAEEDMIDPKICLETRRFSLELRHGIPPKYIVEQIDKSNDIITSFSRAVSRVFKAHFLTEEDLRAIHPDEQCPECAQKGVQGILVPSSGCFSCSNNCGYSKCG